jgi:hypothetical protein
VVRDKDAQEIHCLESHFLPYILQQPEGKTDGHMEHMEHILWEQGMLPQGIVGEGMEGTLPSVFDI